MGWRETPAPESTRQVLGNLFFDGHAQFFGQRSVEILTRAGIFNFLAAFRQGVESGLFGNFPQVDVRLKLYLEDVAQLVVIAVLSAGHQRPVSLAASGGVFIGVLGVDVFNRGWF
jgi:hypothetical protein